MRDFHAIEILRGVSHVLAPRDPSKLLQLSEVELPLSEGVRDILGGHIQGGIADSQAKAASFVVPVLDNDGPEALTFEDLFRSADSARDNYLSRLFGMISEEVLRIWAADERAPYRNLGRPTLYEGIAFATLDFTLESRADGRRYVAEQKAELAFERYRYLRLNTAAQVEHHRANRAFGWLLEAALNPSARVVKVGAKPIEVHGAILVWGATTPDGRTEAMTTFGFADVLSVEAMLADLRAWGDSTWAERIEQLRAWTNELLDGLR